MSLKDCTTLLTVSASRKRSRIACGGSNMIIAGDFAFSLKVANSMKH